jgi:hypothetical protein
MGLHSSSQDRKEVVLPELTPKHTLEGLAPAVSHVNISKLQHGLAPPTPDPYLDTNTLSDAESPTVPRFLNLLS